VQNFKPTPEPFPFCGVASHKFWFEHIEYGTKEWVTTLPELAYEGVTLYSLVCEYSEYTLLYHA
jgi:hypothetical protein